jgi:DNA-binding MarR family transcriptional regulator
MSRDTLAIMGRGPEDAQGSHELPPRGGPGQAQGSHELRPGAEPGQAQGSHELRLGGEPGEGQASHQLPPGGEPGNGTARHASEPGGASEGGGHRPLRDEVDELVAGWRAERPDLDVEPLQVLSRVSRLARHLDRARMAAFATHELQAWEFDVLSALRRQGPPYQLSPGALLRATLVTSGTMTNRIDRLASAGLVSRRPDPADKRGVLVALTDRGRAAADAALANLLASERQLLTGLDGGQRRELAALLRILLAPFDANQAPDSARS